MEPLVMRIVLILALCMFAGTALAETGRASWYQCCNPVTACGVRFNPSAMGAAHRTLPCGTKARVTDLDTRRSVIVTITDRGPFTGGRVIDLYRGAADALGIRSRGVARVRVDRL